MNYGLFLCPRGQRWKKKRSRKDIGDCDYYLVLTEFYSRNEFGH